MRKSFSCCDLLKLWLRITILGQSCGISLIANIYLLYVLCASNWTMFSRYNIKIQISKVLSGRVRQHPPSLVNDSLKTEDRSQRQQQRDISSLLDMKSYTSGSKKGLEQYPSVGWPRQAMAVLCYLGEKEATISKGIESGWLISYQKQAETRSLPAPPLRLTTIMRVKCFPLINWVEPFWPEGQGQTYSLE